MSNTYPYSAGERWSEGEATDEDKLNLARQNADHLHEALNTIMSTDDADGTLLAGVVGIGWDGIADAGGGGDYSTLQAADDDLDASAYVLYVKQGTYAAGVTVSTDDARIVVGPGTVIQGAVTLSGNNVTLILGAGCDVQSTVTISGIGCSLLCQNGCDLDGIIISGDQALVDGGGWATIVDGGTTRHAIDVNNVDVIIQNLTAQTTGGGGQAYDAIRWDGTGTGKIVRVKIPDSDQNGILINNTNATVDISDCDVSGCDLNGIGVAGTSTTIRGCRLNSNGGDGIGADFGSADDSRFIGNECNSNGAYGISIGTNDENCVVVGNRCSGNSSGQINDASGTSTVTGNDTT